MSDCAGERMQRDGLVEKQPRACVRRDEVSGEMQCNNLCCCSSALSTLGSVRCQSVLQLPGSLCFPGTCHSCLLSCHRRSRFQVTLGHFESYIKMQ